MKHLAKNRNYLTLLVYLISPYFSINLIKIFLNCLYLSTYLIQLIQLLDNLKVRIKLVNVNVKIYVLLCNLQISNDIIKNLTIIKIT